MNVSKHFLDLATKIKNQKTSLDEVVQEIHGENIRPRLDEEAISKLHDLAKTIADECLLTAYYLAYLTCEAAKVIEDKQLLGDSTFALAGFSLSLADYSSAIKFYKQSLSIFEKTKDRRRVRTVNCNMGYAYYSLGQHQKAIDCYEEALKVARDSGDVGGEIHLLRNIGDAYDLLRQRQKAIDCYRKALKIARKIKDIEEEGICANNLGIVYESLGDYIKARSCYEEALGIARKMMDKKREANRLGNLGDVHCSLQQFKPAIGYYEQALEIAVDLEDKEDETRWMRELGDIYICLGEYKKALGCHERALKLARDNGDEDAKGLYLGNTGIIYARLGRFEKAIACFEESLKMIHEQRNEKSEQNEKNECNLLGNLGNVYVSLGQYKKAMDYFEKALEIARKVEDKNSEQRWLGALGNPYYFWGEYEKAVSYFEGALEIAKEIKDKSGERVWINNLGVASLSFGCYQKAIAYCEEAVKVANEIGDKNGEDNGLISLGNIYEHLGQYKKAIGYYKKGLKIAQCIGDKWAQGRSLGNIGSAYNFLERRKKAISYFNEALKLARDIGDKNSESIWLCGLGIAYTRLGYFQKAIDYYEIALRIAQDLEDLDGQRVLKFNLGLLYDEELSKPDRAYYFYKQSIQLSELMGTGFIEESHKLGFSVRIVEAYSRMISICAKLSEKEEAYEYTEKAKSRALLALLSTTDIGRRANLPTELEKKEHKLLGQLQQMQIKFEGGFPRQKVDVNKILKELQATYDQIEKYDSEYVSLRRGKPLRFHQVRELLNAQDRKTCLIEYFMGINKIIIFLIHPDEPKLYMKEVPIAGKKVYRLVRNYFRKFDNYSGHGDMKQTWQELSQHLFSPLAGYVERTDLVYIVPHGVLHYIPFHALKHEGQYLIQKHQIVYSPSASVLKYCQAKRRKSRKSCLSLGVVFEDEAEIVAKLFNASAYKGRKVTKDLVKSKSADKDIIHFSCHSFFDRDKPTSPGLILANGEIMTMGDVYQLKLNAYLVTLSACATGINEQRPGDELLGLTRGFLYAGTPSLLVSLWPVDAKSTQLLMEKFYKYLQNEGMSKSDALQNAQLDVMKVYEHPYHWAPFILVGDWQ